MDLNTPVEIAQDEYKPLGECTAVDLTGAARLLKRRGAEDLALAEAAEAAAAGLFAE